MDFGGPGKDFSLYDQYRIRGTEPSRQKGVRTAECAACGVRTQDFVTYDCGPNPLEGRPFNRGTMNLCVRAARDKRGYIDLDARPEGCNTDYVDFATEKINSGNAQGLFMHDLFRMFVRSKNPTVTFTTEFVSLGGKVRILPGLPGGPELKL